MSATYATAGGSPAGRAVAHAFDALTGHGYCLLTTFRWTGAPVASCERYGRDGDRLYVRTAAAGAVAKRVWNNGTATVAPCTREGRPLGAPARASVRVIPPVEAWRETDWVDLEVTPAPSGLY